MGNLASVYNACHLIDAKATIVKNPEDLKNFDRVILPGVGAYKDAMEHLIQTGMNEAVYEYAKSGKPMIGICLGMQLLFESSTEFGHTDGKLVYDLSHCWGLYNRSFRLVEMHA